MAERLCTRTLPKKSNGHVYVGEHSVWACPYRLRPVRDPQGRVRSWALMFSDLSRGPRRVAVFGSKRLAAWELRQAYLKFVVMFPVYALRGKDLVCECPNGSLCHADWLLALANR